jgi:predicted SnoaL-like aldol condensation-catalyzing enzyme
MVTQIINIMSNSKSKQNAIDFYRMAYEGNPRTAVERFVGDDYIQHNPLVGDGKEAFIAYFEKMNSEYPEKDIEFVRVIGEADLVALHTHQTWPGNVQYVTMDFFRFDTHGKIVEHWDAMQEIPKHSENGNLMY